MLQVREWMAHIRSPTPPSPTSHRATCKWWTRRRRLISSWVGSRFSSSSPRIQIWDLRIQKWRYHVRPLTHRSSCNKITVCYPGIVCSRLTLRWNSTRRALWRRLDRRRSVFWIWSRRMRRPEVVSSSSRSRARLWDCSGKGLAKLNFRQFQVINYMNAKKTQRKTL